MESNETNKKHDLKKIGKKAAQTAAGAGLAASLFLGSAFGAPAKPGEDQLSMPQTAIVQTLEPVSPAEAPPAPAVIDEEKRAKLSGVSAWLSRQPIGVRLLLLIPVWAIGAGVIWAAIAATGALSVPIVGAVIKFMVGALAVFGLAITAQKAVFPEVPLKELLSKKNLTALIIAACVIAAAGSLSGLLWPDKPYITLIVDAAAAVLFLLYFLIFVKRKKADRAK